MSVAVLIMAAGRGERMGTDRPKCFLPLAGSPLFLHSLRAFARVEEITRAVLVVPSGWEAEAERAIVEQEARLTPQVVAGGADRAASVRAGLAALAEEPPEIVAIHDGARPLVSPQLIAQTVAAAREFGAALAATPITDTLKRAGDDLLVVGTPPREGLWRAQTPQTFRFDLIQAAHERPADPASAVTDDAMLVEAMGHPVRICPSSAYNLKVTTPEDLKVAERLLSRSAAIRIGHGYDLHRLAPGRRLILGGVTIPWDQGLLGHSDGDVICHALADALLGAAALGDIGTHFPDDDPRYAGADSMVLLTQVTVMVAEAGLAPVNCDVTVLAEAPKLRPHVRAIRERLAEVLGVAVSQVSIKAKTMEGLGPVGEGQAIAAHALALLERR